MKALSVSQPFAGMIVAGRKIIELRRWNTKFRGEFLVHAPLRVRTADCTRLGIKERPVTGAIIGKAEIYDVRRYHTKKEVKNDAGLHFSSDLENTYGFLLRNAVELRVPIPYKGRLKFFEVSLPENNIGKNRMRAEIIDEEYRYQWIGRH